MTNYEQNLFNGLLTTKDKYKEKAEGYNKNSHGYSYVAACYNTIVNLLKFLRLPATEQNETIKNDFLKTADFKAKRALMLGFLLKGEDYRIPWFITELLEDSVIEKYRSKYINIPEYDNNRVINSQPSNNRHDYAPMPSNDVDINIVPDENVEKAARQHILKATINGWRNASDEVDFYSGNHTKLINKGYTIGQLQSRANQDNYRFNFDQPIAKPKIWNRLEIRTQPEVIDILKNGTDDEIMDLVLVKRFRPNVLCTKAKELGVYNRLPAAITDPDAFENFTKQFQANIMRNASSKKVQEAIMILHKAGYLLI